MLFVKVKNLLINNKERRNIKQKENNLHDDLRGIYLKKDN